MLVFSYPLLRGYGRHPLNSSTLPLDYTTNVIIVIAAIWIIAIVVIVVRTLRRGRP